MNVRRNARLVLGVAVLGAGVAVGPAAAVAAPAPETAKLAAVTEKDPETGKNKRYQVGPDEVAPVALGVTNVGDTATRGLVVQLRVYNDIDFAARYDNCWYAVNSNQDTAWCEFDDQLDVEATLALTGPVVKTAAGAQADRLPAIVFRWTSKEWADGHGGVQALAQQDAGLGTTAVRGTGGTLSLTARTLPISANKSPLNFAYVGLTTAPSPEPTPSATASPSATPSGVPTTPGTSPAAPGDGDAGAGGGLPVTGAGTTTLAGIGVTLLLLGGGGYLVARRRRTRFSA